MEQYGAFAYLYDKLTPDVDYVATADLIEKLINTYCEIPNPTLLCDLACGTGSFLNQMADRGYDATGIDASEDMLDMALKKRGERSILYLNQDVTQFELYGTMDVITCLLDSVNHITEPEALSRMFALAANYLNPGGLFIFDVNTRYKFEQVLADNTFVSEEAGVFYVWENHYDKKTQLLDFDLTFFVEKDGLYTRVEESHTERCYSEEELGQMLLALPFDLAGRFCGASVDACVEPCQRMYYVLRKK